MAINIKPRTFEIYVDIMENNVKKPIMIAYFGEKEETLARDTAETLRTRAMYPVRLIVKGI